MPYARNSDLPTQVRDALPEAAQTRFRTVVNSALERGLSDGKAFGSGWAVIRNGWEKPKDGGKWVHKANGKRSLFVSRPVENGQDLVDWAKAQGFSTTLDPDAMHVTQCYSKEPLDWPYAHDDALVIVSNDGREVIPLGDQGAMVLRFDSPTMTARWDQLKELGAKSDFPSFKPHITISWKAKDVDPANVKPYIGTLILGPERFREVDPDWKPSMVTEKANPYHDETGRFTTGGSGGGDSGGGGGGGISDEAIRQAGNGIGMVAGAAVSAAMRQFTPGKVPSKGALADTISRIATRAKVSGGVIRDALRRGFKAALTMSEGEARTLETTLQTAKADNKAWLQAMIDALDAFEPDVEKAGARHNSSDRKMVQEMHDHAVKLGAECSGMGKADLDDERFEKFDALTTIDQNGEPVSCASVIKVDDSLGLVFGWAMICKEADNDYFDVQDDHIPEDSMLKASTDFMLSRRVAKEMHFGDETGTIVFAFPVTEDVAKAMEITTKRSGLMIAMKPNTVSLLNKFKSGPNGEPPEYTGFSIGGQRLVDETYEEAA